MYAKKLSLVAVSALLAIAIIVWPVPASATVLIFEGGMPGNSSPMPDTYGDNVSGAGPDTNGHLYGIGNGWTPNIQVDYSADVGTSAAFANWDGDPGVLYLEDGNPLPDKFWVTFTPDAGYGAQINSFRLNDWGANDHVIDWTIYEDNVGGTVLDSGSFGPGGDTTISTAGLSYIGTSVLELHHTAGTRTFLAVDDLNFDQVGVPEPSVGVLLLAAFVGLAFVRLRKRIV